MEIVRFVFLGLRFLLELCLLGALAYWGSHLDQNWWIRGLALVAAPLLAAVVWGAFVAPKARWPLADPGRLVLELVLFGLGALALWAAGRPVLAMVLAVTFVVDRGVLMWTGGTRHNADKLA